MKTAAKLPSKKMKKYFPIFFRDHNIFECIVATRFALVSPKFCLLFLVSGVCKSTHGVAKSTRSTGVA